MSVADFYKRLNELLKKSGKTHWQLASDLGVSEGTVREWLRIGPFYLPSRENIDKLAKYFGVHQAYLEYGIDNEIIQMATELKEYKPETFEKLKQIISIVHQINMEKRKETILEKKKESEEQIKRTLEGIAKLFKSLG